MKKLTYQQLVYMTDQFVRLFHIIFKCLPKGVTLISVIYDRKFLFLEIVRILVKEIVLIIVRITPGWYG